MAVTVCKQSIQVSRYLGLGDLPVLTGIEAASQAFKKGAPLKDSSGKLAILGADDVTGLLGIAQHDATGVTNDEVKFVPPLPGVVFCAELNHTTNGTATIEQTDMYAKYGLSMASTDKRWYVDKEETASGTTDEILQIVGFLDPVGTVKGRVEFIFLANSVAWAS